MSVTLVKNPLTPARVRDAAATLAALGTLYPEIVLYVTDAGRWEAKPAGPSGDTVTTTEGSLGSLLALLSVYDVR
jgi:hypothetical protein